MFTMLQSYDFYYKSKGDQLSAYYRVHDKTLALLLNMKMSVILCIHISNYPVVSLQNEIFFFFFILTLKVKLPKKESVFVIIKRELHRSQEYIW